MIVRNVREIIGTERDAQGKGWKSRRLILAGDGLKYSVHETLLDANIELSFSYEMHRETVYCIEGEGSIYNVSKDETSALVPGTIYSAGIGEPHVVKTKTPMKVLCIFDPPLVGREEAK